MSPKTTTLHLTADEAQALRDLAVAFGLYIPKGPGAGELGNARALVAQLAAAYRANPQMTINQLRAVFTDGDAAHGPSSTE